MEEVRNSQAKRIIVSFLILLALFFLATFPYWLSRGRFVFSEDRSEIAAPPGETMEPNMLIIVRLNIQAPIIYVDKIDENQFQEALRGGVVHYPGTAVVGEDGNAYIFGHSSDYIWSKGNYKTIFANLPSIKVGENVIASDPGGHKFTFKVIESKVVSPNDTSVLEQGDGKRVLLTLQTSYPVGTALRRFVVIAELTK